MIRREVFKRPCSQCGADRGEPCRNARGSILSFHEARLGAASTELKSVRCYTCTDPKGETTVTWLGVLGLYVNRRVCGTCREVIDALYKGRRDDEWVRRAREVYKRLVTGRAR